MTKRKDKNAVGYSLLKILVFLVIKIKKLDNKKVR
jgi:hypothetical protein